MPFAASAVSKGLWFNQIFVRLVGLHSFQELFPCGMGFNVCLWAFVVEHAENMPDE